MSGFGSGLPFGLTLMMNEVSSSLIRRKRGVAKVVTMVSDHSFVELLGGIRELGIEIDCSEVSKENGFTLWRCSAVRGMHGVHLAGNFYVLQNGLSLFFITGEKNIFLRNVIFHISHKLFPELLRAYVSSEDLFELLANFSQSKKAQLRYNEFDYKKMFGKAFTIRRHEKRLDPEKYELFQEAFKKAREQGGWVDRIRIFSEDYRFSVARSGVMRFYKGSFSDYYSYFMKRITELASEKWKIFEKRGRQEVPLKEVHPILVKFDFDVFDDAIVRKQFLQIISAYPDCSYSVVHGGNPHIYVAILDRIDNSSFTIRTYGTNSLVLSPQIRTTKASLVRFSKHLMDNFQEGKMADFHTEGLH